MSNNFYNILNTFNKIAQEPQQPAQQQSKPKTKLEESIQQVSEKYMGFKKTEKAVAKSGAKDPAAVAASIGRKKYGKEKFQKAAAAGKKLGEGNDPLTHVQPKVEKPTIKGTDKKAKSGYYPAVKQVKKLNKPIDEAQLDELSSGTLRNYVNKSVDDLSDRSSMTGVHTGARIASQAFAGGSKNPRPGEKDSKIDKRKVGISRAISKLGEQDLEEKAPPGAKAERMVKGIKKSMSKDGKLTPKEKAIAYATAWKTHNKGKVEETIKAMFDAGYSREQIAEGWEEMMKDVEKRSKEEKGTGKFDKKKTDTGIKYTRKYDAKSGESEDTGKDGEGKDKEKRGRGRPKKNTNESTATIDKMVSGLFESQHSMDYMSLQKVKPIEPSRMQGSSNPLKRAATNMAAKAVGGIGKAVRKGLDTFGHGDDEEMLKDLRAKTFKEEAAEDEVQESLNQMRRIAGLPVIETKDKKAKKDYDGDGEVESGKDEYFGSRRKAAGIDESADKADKDYDGDGEIESGKDEYLGSKIAAAKKAGKLKEGEMCSKCDCDPCECDDDKEKVDECMTSPIAGMAQDMQDSQGKMNISTNMNSDGNKSVTITADGDAAGELMQMLKLAGMGNGAEISHTARPDASAPAGVALVVDSGNEEEVDEDSRYAANTTPKERVMPIQSQTKGGDGDVAGREKKMTPNGYQFGDNPRAMRENASLKLMKEYESIKVKK